MQKKIKKHPLSKIAQAKIYFAVVAGLSLLWIGLFINSNAEWVQQVKETLNQSPVLKAADDSFYNSRIDPIFEKYCVACHNGDKDKGHLRLDSYRQLTFSGKSEADLTQDHENLLVERMALPETDRLAMPPYGRDRQTKAELALIKLWLSKGATGQLPESAFPEAPAKAKEIKFEQIDWHHIEQTRAPNAAEVKRLQNEYANVLHYQARTSKLLVLDSFPIAKNFDDSTLAAFTPIANDIIELNIRNTAISDNSAQFILNLNQLEKLNLSGTKISTEVIEELLSLSHLKQLTIDKNLSNNTLIAQAAKQAITLTLVNKG